MARPRLFGGELLGAAVLMLSMGCASRAQFGDLATPFSNPSCSVERVTYVSAGFRIVAWIIIPAGPGPFPVLVYNHGSNVGADLVDHSQESIWRPASGCVEYLTESKRILFLPEGRGYAGSEGPTMGQVLAGRLPVMQFLAGRAADVNAGVSVLKGDPRVRAACIAIAGVSHGGVVSLLAAGESRYQAVVAQSTGASYRSTTNGVPEMLRALDKIDAPILLQHAANDTLVPPEVSRKLAEAARQAGKSVTYQEYPGIAGVEGHGLMTRLYLSVWQTDFSTHLDQALAGCA